MTGSPIVSVCLICYNQEQYIRQAIESILLQKVSFQWEIVIADDCSTDDTGQIIQEYYERFPDLIRLIKRKRNIGAAKNFNIDAQIIGRVEESRRKELIIKNSGGEISF